MAGGEKVQYAIDIAATMGGGTKTIDELNRLTDGLVAGGKDASFFNEAIAQLENELRVVSDAAAAAGAALSEGNTRYRELEKAALSSAKAAERAALKHGGAVPRELYDEAQRASAALEAEAQTLAELESAASSASAKQASLAGSMKNLQQLSKHTTARLGGVVSRTSALQGAMGSLGGPLAKVSNTVLGPVKGFAELSNQFGATAARSAVVVAVAAAVVVAVAAITVAVVAGTVAVAAWGVKLADVARSARLSNEAFSAMSAENAAAASSFADVTRSTGVTADRLRGLTKQLRAAKVSAADMPDALRAAAVAEAALGQGGADEFLESVRAARGEVSGLARDTQVKLGGIVSRQLLSLDAQSARLKSNVATLFSGLQIEGLLVGMSLLVGLFDENTASGKALRFLFETLVQPLIDGVTKLFPLVEAFFLGFMIGAMKVYVALKPLIKTVKELLGFDDETSAETFKAFTVAGEVVLYVLGAIALAFGVFVVSVIPAAIAGLASLIATVLVAAAPFLAIAAAIAAVGFVVVTWGPQIWQGMKDVFAAIVDGITTALDWLAGLPEKALNIGAEIMAGLARGIMAGVGAVVSAISGAVGSVIGTAKSLLGIASPSKVFGDIGAWTSEGFAEGVEDEAGGAHAAMRDLVAPPSDAIVAASAPAISRVASDVAQRSGQPAADASQNAASNRSNIDLSGVTFVFEGVSDAASAEQRFRDALRDALSGVLTEQGASA